jgi:hypothetical protein
MLDVLYCKYCTVLYCTELELELELELTLHFYVI